MAKGRSWERKGAAARKKEIREAAEGLFSQFGVLRTSMADVAEKAGVSRSTLYAHFPNKRALHRDVLERRMAELNERGRIAAQAETDTAERLVAVLDATVGQGFAVATRTGIGPDLIELARREAADVLQRAEKAQVRLLVQVLSAGEAAGEISLTRADMPVGELARMLLAVAMGLVHTSRRITPRKQFRRQLALVTHAVTAYLRR